MWHELAHLDQVQAERLHLSQHAAERGPVQQAVSTVSVPYDCATSAGKMARRCLWHRRLASSRFRAAKDFPPPLSWSRRSCGNQEFTP